MTNILAIETSSDACSIAVSYNNKLFSSHKITPQKHTENFFTSLKEVLQKAQLQLTQIEAIAVGCGPGSFTGVRLACSVAQGLGYSLNLPIIKVSSLEIIAKHALHEFQTKNIVVLVDAHMDQIYLGKFKYEKERILSSSEEAIRIEEFSIKDFYSDTCFIGSGCNLLKSELKNAKAFSAFHLPHALDLLSLAKKKIKEGKTIDPEKLAPIYLSGEENWIKS